MFGIRACGLGAHKVGITGMSLGVDTPLFPLGLSERHGSHALKVGCLRLLPHQPWRKPMTTMMTVMVSFSPVMCSFCEAHYLILGLTALLGGRQDRNFSLLIGEAASKNLSS